MALDLSWITSNHLRKTEGSLKTQVSVALFRIVRERCLRRINNSRIFSGGREFGGGGEPEVTTQESTIQPGRTTTLTFNHPDNRKRLMKPVVNATDKIWLRGEYDFPWICRKTMLACRYTGSRRVGLIAARLSVMLKW